MVHFSSGNSAMGIAIACPPAAHTPCALKNDAS